MIKERWIRKTENFWWPDLQSHTSNFCLFLFVRNELLSLTHTQEKGLTFYFFQIISKILWILYKLQLSFFYLLTQSLLKLHETGITIPILQMKKVDVQRDKVICSHGCCIAELEFGLLQSDLQVCTFNFYAFSLQGRYLTGQIFQFWKHLPCSCHL